MQICACQALCKCGPFFISIAFCTKYEQTEAVICSLVVELVASQAVKMCITPSAPQGPCIFMGLPLTSMLRLSCGLSEQTIQLGWGGGGLEVSVVCVCRMWLCVCMQVCSCMSTCAHVCVCLHVICKCFTEIWLRVCIRVCVRALGG